MIVLIVITSIIIISTAALSMVTIKYLYAVKLLDKESSKPVAGGNLWKKHLRRMKKENNNIEPDGNIKPNSKWIQ